MLLEGSCHCHRVRFSAQSHTPQPYMRCYCGICRKTQGGGGYAINIMAQARTLKVSGREHVSVYRARLRDTQEGTPEDNPRKLSSARRHFCKHCGSGLWLFDPRWPASIYPFASAIDTPLPVPPERVHLMLDFKPKWVHAQRGPRDTHFPVYPEEAIIDWHTRRGLQVE